MNIDYIRNEDKIISEADELLRRDYQTDEEFRERELTGYVDLQGVSLYAGADVSRIRVTTETGTTDLLTNVPVSFWTRLMRFRLRISYIPPQREDEAAKILSVYPAAIFRPTAVRFGGEEFMDISLLPEMFKDVDMSTQLSLVNDLEQCADSPSEDDTGSDYTMDFSSQKRLYMKFLFLR